MEMILFAMVGGSNTEFRPQGLLVEGMCVPIAATEKAKEVIFSIGEESTAQWIADNDIRGPKAGGLWVLELSEIKEDDEAPEGWSARLLRWRHPVENEIGNLLLAQRKKAGEKPELPSGGQSNWAYVGAFV